jgi:hypothetical protein
MMEIQDAARVITENVDKEAKIIFGAIKDDRLKKNEVKVTVIASGFPENTAGNSPLFQFNRKEKEETKETGKIFNTFSKPSALTEALSKEELKEEKPEPVIIPQSKQEPVELKPKTDDLSEDEWGAIPAFLRRKK